MMIKLLLAGLASHVPCLCRFRETGGTISARYCYSVWLRHLVVAHRNGLPTNPGTVAELGPGDSVGIGLAALCTGARAYRALDVVEYASLEKNLGILDELIGLFRERAAMPDEREFPKLKPYLESYEFPRAILGDQRLDAALEPARLEEIRSGLVKGDGGDGITIRYIVPWDDPAVVREGSVDMVYSQAVLEHVDDLRRTYGALFRWLKPGGFMTHQIDFKSHGTAERWNGHWSYSDFTWKIIKGRRPYLINREPLSGHLRYAAEAGFELLDCITVKDTSGIGRESLAGRFKSIPDEDLVTSGAFAVWRKPPAA